QDIIELEKLCEKLYSSTSTHEIHEANKVLENFANSSDCLNKCQILLERGTTAYSQYIASIVLIKAISRNTVILSPQNKYELRCYILNYLYSRNKLATFVKKSLVQLFAKITKFGWFDVISKDNGNYPFREILQDVSKFVQNTPELCVIGIQLLSELVNEINHLDESEVNRSLTKHRKISSSFRDTQLLEIFSLSCSLLKDANRNITSIFNEDPSKQQERDLISQLLELCLNCLMYDFIGTACSNEDTNDDLSTVQIPSTWRSVIMDFSNIELFYNLYFHLPAEMASNALACLVQLSAIRRSFFNNTERMKYLNELCTGVKKILATSVGLDDAKCYHEFCRLLARLKCNYQLSELIKLDYYPEFIQMIAKFSITSLRMWRFSQNSLYYLLSLWQRMVASVPYIKAQEPHLLEIYTPEITSVFITSRLELVSAVVRDNIEDPFSDLGTVYQQLEQISIIGRCEYEKTCKILVELFDETAQQFQNLIKTQTTDRISPSIQNQNPEMKIKEGQLSWLVYIIGAVIGGRSSYSLGNTEEHDTYDGEMVVRVLQLMDFINNRLEQSNGTLGCEKLDLAILNFFEQFRKIFIGDQVQKSSKVYRRMSELLGIQDETMWLNVVTSKIILNLKFWTRSERIISKTLNLLNDLAVGYSSVRKLMKLDSIHFILANHTSENFPFLGFSNPEIIKEKMKCRTTFYTALGRLLNLDFNDDDDTFERFIRPLSNQLDMIGNIMSQATNKEALNEIKLPLVGLARDLRGLAFAFNSRAAYMQLFDWLYPNYVPLFTKAIEVWYNEPFVTTPILKLMSELVQNRSQRLTFEISSPNGILLFREASRLVCTYGSRIVTVNGMENNKDQIYQMKLKGISICFNILKWSLSGGYVNFGVFRLYNDNALNDALEMFVKMLLSFEQNNLRVYSKLSQTYYGLLETLTSDHMSFVSMLEPQVFLYLLSTISEGLSSIDSTISTSCCTALDHIITFLFKNMSKQKRGHQSHQIPLIQIYQQQPQVLQQILSTVINIIIFEDCKNQWSMSRPLLGLILLNEQYFDQWRNNLISSQAMEKREAAENTFKSLMNGIERTLSVKNRDKFTQNIATFRRDLNECFKSNSTSTNVIQHQSQQQQQNRITQNMQQKLLAV
ncbi:unnamed protein product, partial [Brachionus calyciflorus]